MHERERGAPMQVEALSLNKIFNSESKTEFEIGTLSDRTMEVSSEDKVFIGCKESGFSADEFDLKNKNRALPKDESKVVKENIEKISENIMGKPKDIYEELGFAAPKDDIETLVTVTDRVKIQLARYSDSYEIKGSGIDISVLEEVTGSSAEANLLAKKINDSYEMAQGIKNYDSGSKEYLLRNNLAPTINNLYITDHTGAGERVSETKLNNEEWTNIIPQVKSMLEKSGLEASYERLDNAKWIIEQKIPLTSENILKVEELQSVDINMEPLEVYGKILDSVLCGIAPRDTLLTRGKDYLQRAQEALNIIENANKEDVIGIVASGKELNIANLSLAAEPVTKMDLDKVTAYRQLEEIRLIMTVEANIKMLKKGIIIEIEPLKNLIKELESYEKEYYGALLRSAEAEESFENQSILKNTINAVDYLKSVPYQIVGKLLYDDNNNTVSSLVSDSKEAISRYEIMSTRIRTDLGDSLTKAFRNIDKILEDIGLEYNKINEKAVKILAYNDIGITEENIIRVKENYEEYSRLIENLKPKTTAHLIKNGINPLETEIKELNNQIELINNEIGSHDERYSDFLIKMEKNTELTKEERDAYIGIYRLLYQVEKNDFAAIGSLLNQGTEVNLKNLASAVKTKKAQNMDYVVSESFGESIFAKNNDSNILSQLRYFSNLVKDGKENLSRGVYEKDIENLSLEAMSKEEDFYKKTISDTTFTELKGVSEQAIQNLLDMGQKINPQNLILSGQIMGSKKGLFKFLEDEAESRKPQFLEALEDSKTMDTIYDDFEKEVKDNISNQLENIKPDKLDINRLKLMGESVGLLKNLSLKRQYQIPVDIRGESCLIKLTIINNSQDKGKLNIETETEDLGKISSEIRIEQGSVKGIILTDSESYLDELKLNSEAFKKGLKELGYSKSDINVCYQSDIKDKMWKVPQSNGEIETKNLYKIAKLFIEQVVRKRG